MQNISNKEIELLKEKYPDNYEELLKRVDEYPIQYLIGDVEFLNTTIKVNENVLIPRYETEYLVDMVIKYVKKENKKMSIIDLGTGSGCIAIALKKNLDAIIDAVDISNDALKLAKENAKLNKTKINFINRDMLDTFNKNYDIIISNPPYIPFDGYVEDIVKNNEPSIALYAKNNGIYFYEEILKRHINSLNKPGLIAFEIGDNQKELLESLVTSYQLKYEFKKDLQGLWRYLFIYFE